MCKSTFLTGANISNAAVKASSASSMSPCPALYVPKAIKTIPFLSAQIEITLYKGVEARGQEAVRADPVPRYGVSCVNVGGGGGSEDARSHRTEIRLLRNVKLLPLSVRYSD